MTYYEFFEILNATKGANDTKYDHNNETQIANIVVIKNNCASGQIPLVEGRICLNTYE